MTIQKDLLGTYINPLSGLQDIKGIGSFDNANQFATTQGLYGAVREGLPSLIAGENPFLTLGKTGLGYTAGKQQGFSNIANMMLQRQGAYKTGLEIGEKEFDLGLKKRQDTALMQYIYNLPKDQQLLAQSNPEEFVKTVLAGYKPTGDMIEYNLATQQGYKGNIDDWIRDITKFKATNIQLNNEKDKLMFKSDLEAYELVAGDANKSRQIANRTKMINELLSGIEGGGLTKLKGDMQSFLGLNTKEASASQVVEALQSVGATLVRTTGSGSTSDMEFGAYKSAFPSMATTTRGRVLMGLVADANATRTSKLADWMKQQIIDKGYYSQADLIEYDRSLGDAMSDKLKKELDTYLPGNKNATVDVTNDYDFSSIDEEFNIGNNR